MCKILKTTLKVANFPNTTLKTKGVSAVRTQTVFNLNLLFSKAVPSGTENMKTLFDALLLKTNIILEIKNLISPKTSKMLMTLSELIQLFIL